MNRLLVCWFLLLAVSAAAACPPHISEAEFAAAQARDDDDGVERLQRYAFARTLKCGWDDARPVVERALAATRDAREGRFYEEAIVVAVMHPQDVVEGYFDASDEVDDDEWLRPLLLRPGERDAAVRRLEQAIPEFVALLASHADGDPQFETYAQAALAAHEVRSGEIGAAQARVARLASLPAAALPRDDDGAELIARLRAALAPMSPAESESVAWVLDRTDRIRRGLCGGLEQLGSGIDPAGLRADLLRAQGDVAGALAVLLLNEWRGPKRSGVSHVLRIVPLLKQRYPGQALRQGWLDAEGSIRTVGERPGFLLYGVDLPLPGAVRENDPADPARVVERPLRRDEAVAYLREWAVFEALFPDGLPPY